MDAEDGYRNEGTARQVASAPNATVTPAGSSVGIPVGRSLVDRRAWITGVYYLLLLGLLAVIVTGQLGHVLPRGIAPHVKDDSEGYVLAVLLPAWIDYVRPQLAGRRLEWPVTMLAAAVMLTVGVVMYLDTAMDGNVRMLNETFLALTVLLPYIQPLRRPSARAALLLGGVAIVLASALEATPIGSVLTRAAEGVVMVLIAPFLFDVTDRGILTVDRPSPLRRQLVGWVLLVLVPLTYTIVWHLHSSVRAIRLIAGYGVRGQEAFVGMFLIAMLYQIRRAVQPPRWPGTEGRPAS